MSNLTRVAAGAVPTAADLARLLDADGVLIYAIEGQALRIVDICPAHPSASSLKLQVGFGVTGLVARTRKPVLLDNDSPRNALHRQLLDLNGAQTVARMCLPLPGLEGDVVGVLAVHRDPSRPFGQPDLEAAEPHAAILVLRVHAEHLW
ncbi:MAG: GAF domain-containing protein, partial [Mycobacterium sp.]|nr:GAF domain-containing protein [Mycobacterium sp.]